MLWTMVVILMILGLLSMVSAYQLGGFVFPMLIVERVVLCIDLITGRKLRLEERIFDDERLH